MDLTLLLGQLGSQPGFNFQTQSNDPALEQRFQDFLQLQVAPAETKSSVTNHLTNVPGELLAVEHSAKVFIHGVGQDNPIKQANGLTQQLETLICPGKGYDELTFDELAPPQTTAQAITSFELTTTTMMEQSDDVGRVALEILQPSKQTDRTQVLPGQTPPITSQPLESQNLEGEYENVEPMFQAFNINAVVVEQSTALSEAEVSKLSDSQLLAVTVDLPVTPEGRLNDRLQSEPLPIDGWQNVQIDDQAQFAVTETTPYSLAINPIYMDNVATGQFHLSTDNSATSSMTATVPHRFEGHEDYWSTNVRVDSVDKLTTDIDKPRSGASHSLLALNQQTTRQIKRIQATEAQTYSQSWLQLSKVPPQKLTAVLNKEELKLYVRDYHSANLSAQAVAESLSDTPFNPGKISKIVINGQSYQWQANRWK